MYDTELPIRDDLRAAHQATVDHWSRPGTWWTAEERQAIVNEVRRARDTQDAPPAWVRISEFDHEIAQDHVLSTAAIDAIWRLTNHPGTLTVEWCDQVVAGFGDESATMTPQHYTELVSVVAQANCIDRFAEGLALGRPTLGEPVEGEPTRVIPSDSAMRDHWIPTVPMDVPAVAMALSGVPAENQASFDLSDANYLPTAEMFELTADRNSLTRMQVELVAARTSKLNECFY